MDSRFKERGVYRIISCMKMNMKIIITVDMVGLWVIYFLMHPLSHRNRKKEKSYNHLGGCRKST